MAKNQVYLIKSGQNSFIEETEAIIGISGGRVGVGTTAPESDFHVTGNTQIDGDLTVKGNFSTINETSVQVDDKNIELGVVDAPTNTTADGGGITLRGATDKTISWLDSNAAWNFNQDVRIDSGKSFKGEKVEAINALGLGLFNESGSGVFLRSSGIGVNLDLDVSGSGNFSQGLYVNGEAVVTGSAGKWYDGNVVGQIFYTGGNVGVNSDSPVYDLDVSGSGNFSQGLYVDGNAVLTGIASSSLGKWQDGNAAGEIFYDAGKVGIGTDDPGYDLHVDGNTYIEGSLNVSSEFKVGSNGAVGDTQPVQDGDIVKWDLANSKWSVGSNIPGGLVTGEVPLGFIKPLASGSSIYQVDFVEEYDAIPSISTDLQIEGDGDIIPYVISGVSASSYNLVFAKNLPNNNYRIHTTFGGRPVYWKTGSDASVNYTEGDVNILRDLTVSGNLTVDGTQLVVNTETIKLEDHNIEIAANAGYDTISDAGISWGTGIAGANSPVSLTYSNNQGFNFAGANVGIGTTNPGGSLLNISPTAGTSPSYFKVLQNSTAGAAAGRNGCVVIVDANYYQDSSDIFSVNGRGVNKLTIKGSGNVGIGTTNPSSNLSIEGSGGLVSAFIKNTTSSDAALILKNSLREFVITNQASSLIMLDKTTNKARMSISSGGNVGIGTTNPGAKLDVDGVGRFLVPTGGSTLCSYAVGATTNANQPVFGLVTNETNNQDRVRFNSDGDSWFNGGNVGIGTTNPLSKLDVDGIIEAGDASSTSGAVGLRIKYSGATDDYVNNFGSMYSSSASLIGYGVRSSGAEFGKFLSTADNANFSRGALLVGSELEYLSAAPQTTTVGDEISLTSRFKILQNGNVGIGTTDPEVIHHVSTKDGATKYAVTRFTADSQQFDIGVGGSNVQVSGLRDKFYIYDGTNNGVVLVIDSAGNVGIGTASPAARLGVVGSGSSLEPTLALNSSAIPSGEFGHSIQAFNPNLMENENQLILVGKEASLKNSGYIGFKWYGDGSDSNLLTFGHWGRNNLVNITGDGKVGIGTTDPGTNKLYVNGNIFANGTITPTSDDRVKHNEQSIVNALETLSKITPKKYIKTTEMYDADHDFELDSDGNPIDENGESVEHRIEAGVIAQQVLAVDELAFAVSAEGVDEDGVVTSPYGLDYNSLFTYAIAAVQEQQQLIESQQSTINDLISRVESLES